MEFDDIDFKFSYYKNLVEQDQCLKDAQKKLYQALAAAREAQAGKKMKTFICVEGYSKDETVVTLLSKVIKDIEQIIYEIEEPLFISAFCDEKNMEEKNESKSGKN